MLVVVVDVNPNQLLYARHSGSFSSMMNTLLTFVNSHLMLHGSNRVALLAAHSSGCSYLYPDPSESKQLLRQQDSQHEAFYQVEVVARRRLKVVLERDMSQTRSAGSESLLAG